MLKHYPVFVLACLCLVLPIYSNAQLDCATDEVGRELTAGDTLVQMQQMQLEDFIRQFAANYVPGQRTGPIIIPIVFHILHRGGDENITDAQARDAVRILNEDFNKQNADLTEVVPQFKSLIAAIGIEFRLATKDPHGNLTNGIEHIYSSQTVQGRSMYAKINPWPRSKYLNIWVVDTVDPNTAGYSHYPGNVQLQGEIPGMDGIMITSNYIGAIGTGNHYRSHALTHEVGHYLNLKHVWGDTNAPGVACGDDDVHDTPITKGYNGYCPADTNVAKICDPAVVENYQNFMDYSYCNRMFTEGQKLRMLATLNSPIADRNNLWTQANLAATGTEQLTTPTAPPIADFSANKFFVCAGNPVRFSDDSYNDSIISRIWSFPDADITNSTAAKPTVSFYTEGWQQITLDVTGINGTGSKTNALVYVADDNIQFGTPFYDDFEIASDFNRFWAPINIDRDAPAFRYSALTGRSGTHSILLNNFQSRSDYNVDELVSPAYNCANLDNSNARVSFYISYATTSSNLNLPLPDSLVLFASKNCGATWTRIYTDGSNALLNAGYIPNNFVPGSDGLFWRKISANIPVQLRAEKVRFKIQVFGAHNSNNLFLDDWNIGDVNVGLADDMQTALTISPNPFKQYVQLGGLANADYGFAVYDITGRKMLEIPRQAAQNGTLNLDLSGLAADAVYFLRVSNSGHNRTLKLVKQ